MPSADRQAVVKILEILYSVQAACLGGVGSNANRLALTMLRRVLELVLSKDGQRGT